jgi:hypothetical protein
MYSTQYLGLPIDPGARVFDGTWLQYYDVVPPGLLYFTAVDLAGWREDISDKSSGDSQAVVLTCGIDRLGHLWLARYDRGKYNPTMILDLIWAHWYQFNSKRIGIEEVYYQKSIRHFAMKRMEAMKDPNMQLNIIPLKASTRVSKDARIRALEPLAFNGGIHCRKDMTRFVDEFIEYKPGVRSCDVLDALAWIFIFARPEIVDEVSVHDDSPLLFDNILKELEERARRSKNDSIRLLSNDLLDPLEAQVHATQIR